MKGWLLVSLLVLGFCSSVEVAGPRDPGTTGLSESDIVAQISVGDARVKHVDGQLEWRNPSILVCDVDTVALRSLSAGGSNYTDIQADCLGYGLWTLPASDWPDGRCILIETIFGPFDNATRIRQQVARVRAVAGRLRIQVVEQVTLACG